MQPQILIAAAGDTAGALPLSPRFRRLAASRVGARHTRLRDLAARRGNGAPPVADGARGLCSAGRIGCRRPSRDGASARPRTTRRSSRPALPGRLGALRFARGRGGSRPGDVRARARPPAVSSQRGRPRLPAAHAAQHVPEPEARAAQPACRRRRCPTRSTSSRTRTHATRRPRSRPASSTPRSPRCPSEFRDVLVAVDITGLSYKETARALRIREGTVMSRLYRARKQVVRTLEPA